MKRIFSDVLISKKKFKFVFNGKEHLVFKKRLRKCCTRFSQIPNNKNYPYQSRYQDNEQIDNDNVHKEIETIYKYNNVNIKENTFSTFVSCINGEEIEINEENSIELMILGTEFGYERLIIECRNYIDTKEIEKKEEIKNTLNQLISKESDDDMFNREERDMNEFEKIIAKYFDIVLEEEEEKLIRKISFEILKRIFTQEEFDKKKLNEKQRHQIVEIIIYHLKKEGEKASILMSVFPLTYFSNSDIEMLMEEKSLLVSAIRIEREDISRMIELKEEMIKIKEKMAVMEEEMKTMKEESKKILEEFLKMKSKETEIIKKDQIQNEEIIKQKSEMENIKYQVDKLKTQISSKKLPYLGDENKFKSKGIFEYLIKHFKGNPIVKGIIDIKGNSGDVENEKILPHIIERNYEGTHWISKKSIESYIKIDLQKMCFLIIDKYIIHTHYIINGGNHLRNWKIEGRTKEGDWTLLDEKNNNCELSDNNLESVFECMNKSILVSAVRLQLTGGNSGGNDHFWINIQYIELFGEIIFNTDT